MRKIKGDATFSEQVKIIMHFEHATRLQKHGLLT